MCLLRKCVPFEVRVKFPRWSKKAENDVQHTDPEMLEMQDTNSAPQCKRELESEPICFSSQDLARVLVLRDKSIKRPIPVRTCPSH